MQISIITDSMEAFLISCEICVFMALFVLNGLLIKSDDKQIWILYLRDNHQPKHPDQIRPLLLFFL